MIFLSAGHYPSKPGASHERFVEHDEAMIWILSLAKELASLGTESLVVPTGILRIKVDFINNRIMNGDIAIEIHFNSFKIWEDANRDGIITDDELKHAGRGCESLYYPGSSRGHEIAEALGLCLAEFYAPYRGSKEGWYRLNKANGPDFFLARTTCPAVILEPEFVHRSEIIISNRDDAIKALAETLKEIENA